MKYYEARWISRFKPECNVSMNPNKAETRWNKMPLRRGKKRKRIWQFKALIPILQQEYQTRIMAKIKIQLGSIKLIEEIKTKKKAA